MTSHLPVSICFLILSNKSGLFSSIHAYKAGVVWQNSNSGKSFCKFNTDVKVFLATSHVSRISHNQAKSRWLCPTRYIFPRLSLFIYGKSDLWKSISDRVNSCLSGKASQLILSNAQLTTRSRNVSLTKSVDTVFFWRRANSGSPDGDSEISVRAFFRESSLFSESSKLIPLVSWFSVGERRVF